MPYIFISFIFLFQSNFSKLISRARKANTDTSDLKQPTSFDDIMNDMPTTLTMDRSGGNFLTFCGFSEGSLSRGLLVFCSDFGRFILNNSKVWVSDGTFTLPQGGLFHQMYVVHGQSADGVPYPAVYCLMMDKSKESYKQMFEVVKGIAPNGPEEVLVDLESAPISLYKHFWPEIVVEACEFHHKRAMTENIKSKGCLTLYNGNRQVHHAIDMYQALSFAPAQEIQTLFDDIIEPMFSKVVSDLSEENEASDDEESIAFDPANKFDNSVRPIQLIEYFTYLENWYIGPRKGRFAKRRTAPYPPAVWSKFNAVLADRYRTSNASENWHSQIQNSINKFANIWEFINWISQEDCLMDLRFKKDAIHIRVNTPEHPLEGGSRRIAVRDRAEKLKNLVQRFGMMPNKSYLESVAELQYDRSKYSSLQETD